MNERTNPALTSWFGVYRSCVKVINKATVFSLSVQRDGTKPGLWAAPNSKNGLEYRLDLEI